jgi:phosphate transport system protein
MSEQQHILSAFDRDLEAIQAHIMKMGGMVEASILDAAKSFDTRDVELAADVRARDKAIDQLEILINDEAAKLLALRSPTAIDLRLVLSVIKVASNLERIGDFSKNMAKRTTVLMEMPHVFDKGQGLRRLAREVELMLKDALDAYVQRDVKLAEEVIQRDRDVDQMYSGLFREYLSYMLEDPRNITPCMHLHLMAKNIERMGDHVTSIAEQVIYFTTGERPQSPHLSSDKTSSDPNLSMNLE